MPQTPEAEAFLTRAQVLSASLTDVLQPSLDDEADLRRLFAIAKDHQRLQDIHVGLVDIFDAPATIRTARARAITDENDRAAKYVMPLSDASRRKDGTACMVGSLDEFKKNWVIFTEGSLSQLDWSNVVVAGGSVQACLAPLSDSVKSSKRSIRKHYHTIAYPSSDIDLFMWGLTPEQAEVKMQLIYEAVRDSIPWDVTCIRTKHTVSIHSQYPYRSIQVVLRLYSSPAEILAGFDVDAACFAYDGERVWGNPRSIVSMMRQCNTVDMTRRSPSYEVRLAKYSQRGFEVYVPSLKRGDIDPTIYERSIARIQGLARLLVLEKLLRQEDRDEFIEARRNLRGRPSPSYHSYRRHRTYRGDLKSEETFNGLEMNDYDVVSLHIPYGPGWHARRIEKLVYQTDLGMNSTFNPKNKDRKLHRHAAFFGTMEECMRDCCRLCPDPRNDQEQELQKEEDEKYIRGRIAFIQEDPGRQSISGSFNPIDVGEWSEQTYIGPTEKFFTAIATHERDTVFELIQSGHDINRRDHVGRTALHVAILSKATAIAIDLIDAGARITPRLVDGRTALHLAAQTDQLDVIQRLLEKSSENQEKIEEERARQGEGKATVTGGGDTDKDVEMKSVKDDDEGGEDDEDEGEGDEQQNDSEDEGDDGGSDDSGEDKENSESVDEKDEQPAGEAGIIPEDKPDEPDVLDINSADWDFGFSPLCYGILYGSVAVVNELLRSGANPRQSAKWINTREAKLPPILLVVFRDDEDQAIAIAERLFLEKVSSATTIDTRMETVFHRAVRANRLRLVTACLKSDSKANTAIKFPSLTYSEEVIFPVVTAIANGHYSMLATLLAYGAKLTFTDEDIHRPQDVKASTGGYSNYAENPIDRPFLPVETALVIHDDVIHLLMSLDATFNTTTHTELSNIHSDNITHRRSLLDWVVHAQGELKKKLETKKTKSSSTARKEPAPRKGSWRAHFLSLLEDAKKPDPDKANDKAKEEKLQTEILGYFAEVKKLFVSKKAKNWNQLYPDHPGKVDEGEDKDAGASGKKPVGRYKPLGSWNNLPPHFNSLYDELFEACFTGKNDRIQKLCSTESKEKLCPLSLSALAVVPDDVYETIPSMGLNPAFTPLYAAIAGQRWETARLLMSLISAQNKPRKSRFKVDDIELEENSENGSDESMDEDSSNDDSNSEEEGSDDGEPIDVTEVANRNTSTQNSSPETFLNDNLIPSLSKGEDSRVSLLVKAIHDDDFQAFVQIGELYHLLPKKVEFPGETLSKLVEYDRVEMLDQFIRWTGLGIEVKVKSKDGKEDPTKHYDGKLYLGLDVHGKKRVDLARKNDPNAIVDSTNFPLVWQAGYWSAMNVLKYLQGDRPLVAYQYYITSNSNARSKELKGVPDLKAALPEWLGWGIGQFGDSPLTAAIIGGKLEIVKWLFSKFGKLMSSALSTPVKFTGYTPLMVAVQAGADPQLIDFLISKGVKVTDKDKEHRQNIFHILADRKDDKLLSHLLKTLARPVCETLVTQQNHVKSTPLHVAVREGAVRIVEVLLEFTKLPLLVRDIDGFTPIHIAVSLGFSAITRLLVEAAPADALYMENGVGATPLEISMLQNLQRYTVMTDVWANPIPSVETGLEDLINTEKSRWDLDKLEEEVPKYSAILEELTQNGKLRKRTKLTTELGKFASVLDKCLQKARAVQSEGSQSSANNSVVEQENHAQTLKYLNQRLASHAGERHIIHLIDVQQSIYNKLPKAPQQKGVGLGREQDDFEEEAATDRDRCMTMQYLNEVRFRRDREGPVNDD